MSTRNDVDDTPLATWLREATPEQRERCATLAGTSYSYLYSLAGGHRQQISAKLAFGIEDATRTLWAETRRALPVVTARQLAYMHDLVGL